MLNCRPWLCDNMVNYNTLRVSKVKKSNLFKACDYICDKLRYCIKMANLSFRLVRGETILSNNHDLDQFRPIKYKQRVIINHILGRRILLTHLVFYTLLYFHTNDRKCFDQSNKKSFIRFQQKNFYKLDFLTKTGHKYKPKWIL